MKDNSFSIKKIINSLSHAFNGIKILFREERNARIHLAASMSVIGLSYYLKISSLEWIAILFSIGLVLMAEAFNTAIEAIADFISPEYNHKIGKIKDLAAGAVLISSFIAVLIGLIILLPKCLHSVMPI